MRLFSSRLAPITALILAGSIFVTLPSLAIGFRIGIGVCFLGALFILLFPLFPARSFLSSAIQIPNSPPPPNNRLCFYGGMLTVLITLGMLEWYSPVYFVLNDNNRQYFPVALQALRGFFATGIFPVWDAYSGLGMAIINGGYALTYPPLYLSYLIADALGNTVLTLECLAFMHFIAAYVVMYAALRRMSASSFLAMCAAASYVLCGYYLIMGRNWMNVMMIPPYMAAFLYLLTYPVSGVRLTKKWALLLALAIGGFYHIGHIQFWLYGLMSFAFAYAWVLIAHGKRAWKDVPMVLAGGLGGLAIAAPLLLVQWLEQQYVPPLQSHYEIGIANHLIFLLTPWFNGMMDMPVFSGGIFTLGAMICCAFVLAAIFRHPLRLPPAGAYVFAAVLSMMFAMGDATPLWPFIKDWPVFNKLRYIDKWIPFLNTFLFASCIVFMAQLQNSFPRARHFVHGCAIIGLLATLYNAMHTVNTFSWLTDKPYPPLHAEMAEIYAKQQSQTAPYRLFNIGPIMSRQKSFMQRIGNNYSSYYHIFSVNRYTQRITTSLELRSAIAISSVQPIQFLQRYSVAWALVTDEGNNDIGPDYNMKTLAASVPEQANFSKEMPELNGTMFYLNTTETDPLVGLYAAESPKTALSALPLSVKPNGLSIDLSNVAQDTIAPSTIIATFLSHRWMRAYAEPEHIALPLMQDNFRRIKIHLAQPAQRIDIVLEAPWRKGFILALFLACCAFASAYFGRWIYRRG